MANNTDYFDHSNSQNVTHLPAGFYLADFTLLLFQMHNRETARRIESSLLSYSLDDQQYVELYASASKDNLSESDHDKLSDLEDQLKSLREQSLEIANELETPDDNALEKIRFMELMIQLIKNMLIEE